MTKIIVYNSFSGDITLPSVKFGNVTFVGTINKNQAINTNGKFGTTYIDDCKWCELIKEFNAWLLHDGYLSAGYSVSCDNIKCTNPEAVNTIPDEIVTINNKISKKYK